METRESSECPAAYTPIPLYADPPPLAATPLCADSAGPRQPVCEPDHISALALLSDSDSCGSVPDAMCRICRCEADTEEFISPCYCTGSLQHVHQTCLLRWLKAYDCVNKHHCELCQYEFKLKPKPWVEWRIPALSVKERRRALCVLVICMLCVLIVAWSINDLIRDIKLSNMYLNWGFWTKLLFIAFGFFILAFQYPSFRHFYLKVREGNQIVLWGEEGQEQEMLEMGGKQSRDLELK